MSLQAWHSTKRLKHAALIGPTRERAEQLAAEIAADRGVTKADLFEGRGHAKVWRARHELYLRLWREDFPIAVIAKALGKHHTTIMHGLQKRLGTRAYHAEMRERFPLTPESYRGAPWAA